MATGTDTVKVDGEIVNLTWSNDETMEGSCHYYRASDGYYLGMVTVNWSDEFHCYGTDGKYYGPYKRASSVLRAMLRNLRKIETLPILPCVMCGITKSVDPVFHECAECVAEEIAALNRNREARECKYCRGKLGGNPETVCESCLILRAKELNGEATGEEMATIAAQNADYAEQVDRANATFPEIRHCDYCEARLSPDEIQWCFACAAERMCKQCGCFPCNCMETRFPLPETLTLGNGTVKTYRDHYGERNAVPMQAGDAKAKARGEMYRVREILERAGWNPYSCSFDYFVAYHPVSKREFSVSVSPWYESGTFLGYTLELSGEIASAMEFVNPHTETYAGVNGETLTVSRDPEMATFSAYCGERWIGRIYPVTRGSRDGYQVGGVNENGFFLNLETCAIYLHNSMQLSDALGNPPIQDPMIDLETRLANTDAWYKEQDAREREMWDSFPELESLEFVDLSEMFGDLSELESPQFCAGDCGKIRAGADSAVCSDCAGDAGELDPGHMLCGSCGAFPCHCSDPVSDSSVQCPDCGEAFDIHDSAFWDLVRDHYCAAKFDHLPVSEIESDDSISFPEFRMILHNRLDRGIPREGLPMVSR